MEDCVALFAATVKDSFLTPVFAASETGEVIGPVTTNAGPVAAAKTLRNTLTLSVAPWPVMVIKPVSVPDDGPPAPAETIMVAGVTAWFGAAGVAPTGAATNQLPFEEAVTVIPAGLGDAL